MSSDPRLQAGTPQASRRGTAFGLAPQIVALSVSGILLLGICVTRVAWYLLERGAIKAATERVETNMRVAWDVLRANGKSFSVADGKLLAGDHVLNGDAATVDKVKNLVGGTCTADRLCGAAAVAGAGRIDKPSRGGGTAASSGRQA
jgi:methyl-accepting chemotaxis protein